MRGPQKWLRGSGHTVGDDGTVFQQSFGEIQ